MNKMACELCARNPHCCQTYSNSQNCDVHYSDVPPVPDALEDEPVAPTLSLGNRILWLTETRAASGIVRWIGRIPFISAGWSAGVEFDNVMPGGRNGDLRGRSYFQSRPGHSLFLPVSELIKVDGSTSGSADRTSFLGRLQDSCSNFAHRRRRDATFGHFKEDYCSNCPRNDFPCYNHYCNRAPVYDRITSRRSLCYDDHPYEMYNACVPCRPLANSSNQLCKEDKKRHIYEDHHGLYVANGCSQLSTLKPGDRLSCTEYPDDEFNRMHMFRKDSMFNPRSSLNLINGFKEWVSCLVLGTNRRKRKNKIVFKDRKAVTSVFLSQNSQSLTGQRLSSFSEYASINLARSSKQDLTLTRSTSKEMIPAIENNQVPESKIRRRKKRPAPLPPIEYPSSSSSIGRGTDINTSNKSTDKMSGNGSVKKDVTKENQPRYKVVKSGSIRTHSAALRRRQKKRKAPLPPPLHNVTNTVTLNSASSGSEKGQKNIQSNTNVILNDEINSRKAEKLKNSNTNLELDNPVPSSSNPKLKKAKRKIMQHHLKNPHFAVMDYIDSLGESASDDNSSGSISFSEEESEEEKYGLVKYGLIKGSASEKDLSLPGTSNFVQYSSDNSDVCLKISIQKTETNVVTVEEVTSPRTVHYTIEEDSSSSELSDESPNVVNKKKAINNFPEPKPNSTDSSSVSTDEVPDKNTIFEELQLKPPTKGSVKDIVHAFNMLANKTAAENVEKKVINLPSKQKISNHSVISDTSGVKNNPKAIQSFPTKWEYQTNKPNFPSNQFLLPIAEESHNETSEQDGNVSVDDTKVKNKPAKGNSHKESGIEKPDNSIDKCSYCSEKHVQSPAKENTSSKTVKKKVAPKKGKPLYESVRPLNKNISTTQASIAALSSLLQENTNAHSKEGKVISSSGSLKHNAKLDHPIMVGLYIEDKSSHRGPIPLLVTPSMSLKNLKKQIEKEYNFPRHQQCWILGESFAVAEDLSLASYGVTEPGCPILLYVMAKDSKSHSLPSKTSVHLHNNLVKNSSGSSDEESRLGPRRRKKTNFRLKKDVQSSSSDGTRHLSQGVLHQKDKVSSHRKVPPRSVHHKRNEIEKKTKSEFHKSWEAEYEKKADYRTLLALDDVDLVANMEKFECPICFLDVEKGEGATLQDCLHSFCKECLASSIQFSETAVIKCPFRNDEYSCESHLQEREIKSLVAPEVYERHLQRSMALAESQALDSFHCKTPDCPGWCLFEDNVNTFLCPVCKRTNCLTCAAIHEGKNCRQYQDDVAFRCDSSEEARKTKEYLQSMVENGEAMECPQCQVILMKKWGCDWLKCSMCHTEVCWVTKGPRWGPGGRGDTSGGCKCMVNGVRCHPKCSYCH